MFISFIDVHHPDRLRIWVRICSLPLYRCSFPGNVDDGYRSSLSFCACEETWIYRKNSSSLAADIQIASKRSASFGQRRLRLAYKANADDLVQNWPTSLDSWRNSKYLRSGWLNCGLINNQLDQTCEEYLAGFIEHFQWSFTIAAARIQDQFLCIENGNVVAMINDRHAFFQFLIK